MSENKVERAMSDIQQEYQGLCLKAGHIQYQIFALSEDLKTVNEVLKNLNLEAAKAKQEEPAKEGESK